jgi:formate hydrogenlyase subunit 3/multisubunit Na+/H+ antiporter MnhD subunit
MPVLLSAFAAFCIVSILTLFSRLSARNSGVSSIAISGIVAGSVLAATSAVIVLVTGKPWEIWSLWQTPLGPLHIGMDALSAVFVILISVVGSLAAIYGSGYLGRDGKKVATSWTWYSLLMAAMLLVVVARDGFTFLMAWEAMSLTSFFLVMFDHEKPDVLKAGWIYLITTHIGTAFLFVMFLMMGSGGTLDFSSIIARGDLIAPGTLKTVIFVAAVSSVAGDRGRSSNYLYG